MSVATHRVRRSYRRAWRTFREYWYEHRPIYFLIVSAIVVLLVVNFLIGALSFAIPLMMQRR